MKSRFNYFLFLLVVFMLAFSFLFLACLSSLASLQKFGNTYYYLTHQLIFGLLLGLILGFIAYKTPLSLLKKWAPALVIANLAVMLLVFLPMIGANIWGASRWINIAGISFQPSEFLKITAILYIAAWISSKLSDNSVSGWKSAAEKGYHNLIYVLVPFVIFLGVISVVLILQPDLSTLGIIGLTLLVMYFSVKTPLWHTVSMVVVALVSLLVLVKYEAYRLDRWLIFLNPESDPLGKGFQIRQSLISLGSGGFFGKGLGMSTQKFGYLPQAISDSIFAVIGEELGIVGCAALIGLFILFFWLGINIAKNSSDRFSKLIAIGIVFWITFQAFINIAAITGIFPIAGVPLPFFSYGGSHLAIELIAVGLLLNISKNS